MMMMMMILLMSTMIRMMWFCYIYLRLSLSDMCRMFVYNIKNEEQHGVKKYRHIFLKTSTEAEIRALTRPLFQYQLVPLGPIDQNNLVLVRRRLQWVCYVLQSQSAFSLQQKRQMIRKGRIQKNSEKCKQTPSGLHPLTFKGPVCNIYSSPERGSCS